MNKPKIRVKNSTDFPLLLARRIARAVWDDRDIGIPLVLELRIWTDKKRRMPRTKASYSREDGMGPCYKMILYGRPFTDDPTHERAAKTLIHHLAWSAVWIVARKKQQRDRRLVSELARLTGGGSTIHRDAGIRRRELELMCNAIVRRTLTKVGFFSAPSSGPGQDELEATRRHGY